VFLLRFLITGGLGFVGSHLIDSLVKKHHKIRIITKSLSKINNIKKSKKQVQIEKINIINFNKLGKCIEQFRPDVIIHLAGNTSHSKSFENPIMDVESNCKSTLFILEKIRELSYPCKFILGSTFIVVGKPKKLPVNEKTPCNPTTIYGTNRLASEYFCKIYNKVYGLDTRIFRITNSYGPREQIVSNKNAINFLIYNAYKNKKITIYNNGKFFRDFIFIDDVISGINKILTEGKAGELYWISSGKKMWFNKFAKILYDYTGCEIIYPKTPNYTKKVDVGNFVVNNSKLRKLGWSPKTSTDIGVKKTLKFFQSK